MTKPRGFTAVKTLTASFFFILAYGLFAVSVYIAGLGVRLSTFVAVSALVFSPLKVPFLAPTPTYRGFFHAAGDLYHSDTHSTSMACSILGLFFILKAFQSRERTFLLGCALIAGAFFLKPAIFMVVAPAVYLFVAFCWRDFTVDRLLGLGVLLAVPIAWFGYIQFSAASANFDSFLPRSAEIAGGTSLTIEPRFFAGYLPKLKGRFPEWIAQSPVRTASAMTLLSFAAFWLAAASGIGQLWKVTRRGIRALKEHVRSNADTYFQLCFFLLAVMVAATLAARFNKNMNWKWSATAAYVFCLPLFVRGITLIKIAPLRWLSWALYALQTAQGVVYLWYYFWVGKVN